MQNHTTCGERICSGMKSLTSVLPLIRSHHERWDGSGYPDRLRGDEIPLLARVIQVGGYLRCADNGSAVQDGFFRPNTRCRRSKTKSMPAGGIPGLSKRSPICFRSLKTSKHSRTHRCLLCRSLLAKRRGRLGNWMLGESTPSLQGRLAERGL